MDSTQLGFLVSGCDRSPTVYMYLPEAKDNFGGLSLFHGADFPMGSPPSGRPCTWGRGGLLRGPVRSRFAGGQAHHTVSTLDGGIGLLLPMQEKIHQWLLILQNVLTTMLPH